MKVPFIAYSTKTFIYNLYMYNLYIYNLYIHPPTCSDRTLNTKTLSPTVTGTRERVMLTPAA